MYLKTLLAGTGGGGQPSEKKNGASGVLKSPCHRYLLLGRTMFLVKKDFVKWNLALKAQLQMSGLVCLAKQLLFSFVTFWFCQITWIT